MMLGTTLLDTTLPDGEGDGRLLKLGAGPEEELETLLEEGVTGVELGSAGEELGGAELTWLDETWLELGTAGEELGGTELTMLDETWLEDTWLEDGVPEPEEPQKVMRRLT